MKTPEQFYKEHHEYKELDKDDKYIVEMMQLYADYITNPDPNHESNDGSLLVTIKGDTMGVTVTNMRKIELIGIVEKLKSDWMKGGE